MKAIIHVFPAKENAVSLHFVPAPLPSVAELLFEALDLSEGAQRATWTAKRKAYVIEDRSRFEVTIGTKNESETHAQVLGFVLRRLAALGIPWELTDASS